MKKISLSGIQKFDMLEAVEPEIKNTDDVLLKIAAVGVCGSDIHYYKEGRIGDQIINFPFTIGHEFSAYVVKVGNAVSSVKPGDLVTVDPLVSCQECSQCKQGRFHTCLNQKFLGCPGQLEGCLTEYIVLPERNCFVVPKNISPEDAALIEPLTIGYYAVELMRKYSTAKRIGILGVGPIGLSVMLSLQSFDIKEILVTDKLNYRLEIAKQNGAAWNVNPDTKDVVSYMKEYGIEPLDAVFDCCGKQEAIDQAVDLLKPGGLLLIVGIPDVDRISFDISKIRRKEITIQNVRRQNECVEPVIELISSGKVKPDFMITHRLMLNKTQEAFELVAGYKDGVLKAVISI